MDAGFRSGRAAAEALGISTATYAAHENGTRRFGPEEARRYARFFHVTPAWLLAVDDQKPGYMAGFKEGDTPSQPLAGPAPTGSSRQALVAEYDLEKPLIPKDGRKAEALLPFHHTDSWALPKAYLIQTLKADPEKTVIVSVLDGDMAPTFLPGDKVIVDLGQRQPLEDGAYLLAKPVRIARLKFTDRESGVVLVGYDNPNHGSEAVSIDRLTILGRVCAIIGRR